LSPGGIAYPAHSQSVLSPRTSAGIAYPAAPPAGERIRVIGIQFSETPSSTYPLKLALGSRFLTFAENSMPQDK
jgi:uncharacterized membrane protein